MVWWKQEFSGTFGTFLVNVIYIMEVNWLADIRMRVNWKQKRKISIRSPNKTLLCILSFTQKKRKEEDPFMQIKILGGDVAKKPFI